MNLLLLDEPELASDGTFTIADRRAEHLRTVLDVHVGSRVRAGVVGKYQGTAEVLALHEHDITLRFEMTAIGASPPALDLVLAVPRPKVLTRTIEIASSFAIRRIDLTNAWRVDKSYLRSPRLAPDALAHAARLGAEQGATVHLPTITVHERLMAMLDSRFASGESEGESPLRLIAHPGAPPLESVVTSNEHVALAIGPEGGWIERELDTFVALGFKPVSLGTPILRVEAAVASALGQLHLLQRMR